MWNIYNKTYDLTEFISEHPGGEDILNNTMGIGDITSLFESYHAFSNKELIKKILNKYEIKNDDSKNIIINNYDYTNYNKLVLEIKKIYCDRSSIKASFSWYCHNIIFVILYIIFFYYAMFSSLNIFLRCISSLFASLLWSSLGFNMMHDGSHYAISTNANTNIFLSKTWQAFSLWNYNIWFYHHVYNHHSNTNQENKDSDLYHFYPLVTKLKISNKSNKLHNFIIKNQYYTLLFFILIFPGLFYGQAIAYLSGYITKKLCTINLPNVIYYNIFEITLMVFNIYCLYSGFYLPTIVYMYFLNFLYQINIIPNHDTYETSVENHYNGNDWLLTQICNSGNFSNKNLLWTYLFGGINYQIEHHLFPNMSYVHYPIIAPIIINYCKINNIPYVSHPTLISAYLSFLKMIKFNSY
jgi:linoleoyl-CoA desaturase